MGVGDGGGVSYDQTVVSYFRPIGSCRPQLWTGVDVRFSAYSSKTNTKILVFVLHNTYNSKNIAQLEQHPSTEYGVDVHDHPRLLPSIHPILFVGCMKLNLLFKIWYRDMGNCMNDKCHLE